MWFFVVVVFLKEKWLGENETLLRGFTATQISLFVLLHFQLFGVCSLKAPPGPRAQSSIGSTTTARVSSPVTSAEPLTLVSAHEATERLALMVSYLPSQMQTAAEDQKGISICLTPGSGYPVWMLFPENKHIFISLVWLQRKNSDYSANIWSEGVLDHVAVMSGLMFTVHVSVLYLDFLFFIFFTHCFNVSLSLHSK